MLYQASNYYLLDNAAKETSFMYSGKKYPKDLIEELIRNCGKF